MPDTFHRNRRRRHRFGTYCRIGTGQRRIKAGRKTQKKKNEQEIQNEVQKVAQEMETSGLEHKPDKAYVFPSIDLLKKGRREKVCQY